MAGVGGRESQELGGLLSLELGKVLASFPFSPFLLLDLDFVMFLQQMLPKIRLTGQGNT